MGLRTGERMATKPLPIFHQATFRRGTIRAARFAPDGQTMVYAAAWEGNPVELFSARPDSPESRALGLPGTTVLAISSSGEMAVSLRSRNKDAFVSSGTLARAPLAGGAPREILDAVEWADWSPNGSALAVVREVGGKKRLEFPIGKVLYETAGWISHARVSPKGDLVAFLDHPVLRDDAGSVAVVDSAGNKKTLAAGWIAEQGLAWTQGGEEIWFTATESGINRAVHAVTLSGKQRLVYGIPGTLTLQDISHDGRVLLTRDNWRAGISSVAPGESKERDLGWHDWSVVRDISTDGRTLLFVEAGEAGGANYAAYVRKTDGSPAVLLGEGNGTALSPDGNWALGIESNVSPPDIVIWPTGVGEQKKMRPEGIVPQWACWFPNGEQLLILGSESGHGIRLYVQELAGGKPRPFTPEGVRTTWNTISPDGKFVAALGPDQKISIYGVEGGQPHPVPGVVVGDVPFRWSADGTSLFVSVPSELPTKVYRLNIATGKKELWRILAPPDRTGLHTTSSLRVTPDGRAYAYSYLRFLSDLFFIERLK